MDSPRLAVIGLGYVGLPLVQEATRRGLRVTGFDVSSAVVDGLNGGHSHVDDVSDESVAAMLATGFSASTSPAVLRDADVVVICVPTPLADDRGPDLEAVRAAAAAVRDHLVPGQLVVLESTTYPGTTEEVLIPILEESGLEVGRDINVAFSPERIDPGNDTYTLRNTPKVVGGFTPACTQRAEEFYSLVVDTVVVAKGLKEAELTKLLENTYRHVNIALVNELSQFCHLLGIDLWDAIRCAATKPFGFAPFTPGPGVGGHCIPIDPNYLSHRVRTHLGQPFRFVELAQEVNAAMPDYVARRAQDLLNDVSRSIRGSRVCLLGITYKANISDQRESPARDVATALIRLGADVSFHDPLVADWKLPSAEVRRVPTLAEAIAGSDLLILLQAHSEYLDPALAWDTTPVLDTRGVLRGSAVAHL
ncbi:MAG: nucleotide sugar dehydrogenase [Actinomycetota bacterium]|nr:nucleotide sugar dehydrogenase [Actinomycetota bacterium]